MFFSLLEYLYGCVINYDDIIRELDKNEIYSFLEQYISSIIHQILFNVDYYSDLDWKFSQKLVAISKLNLNKIVAKPIFNNFDYGKELAERITHLNDYKSSLEKIDFLYEFLSDLKSQRAEMDDFLAALIHIFVESKIQNIFSNLNFLTLFANKSKNHLQEGWTLIQIISAVKMLRSIEIYEDKLINYEGWFEDEKEIKSLLDRFSLQRNKKSNIKNFCRIF